MAGEAEGDGEGKRRTHVGSFLGVLECGIRKFPQTSLHVVCCQGESLFWFLFVTAVLRCLAYHGSGPNLFLLFCELLPKIGFSLSGF